MSSDESFFNYAVICYLLMGPVTYLTCRYKTAPYGKHHRNGDHNPIISPVPYGKPHPLVHSPPLPTQSQSSSSHPSSFTTFIAPLYTLFASITLAFFAFAYNIFNSYLQTRWVSHYADYHTDEWFWWRFCCGFVIFVNGMVANVRSDMDLLRVKGGGGGYKIVRGGFFEYVSCANYFGEIVEWSGWAVMMGAWVGLGFVLLTCANLVPRARANHKWYYDKFGEDYPNERKAVIPFVY